jgi:hypothetical protein
MSALLTERMVTGFAETGRDLTRDPVPARVQEFILMVPVMFRMISSIAGRFQQLSIRGVMPFDRESEASFNSMFRDWLAAAESGLADAERLMSEGHSFEGLDDVRLAMEEARHYLDLDEIEAQMPPYEAIAAKVTNRNPDPERYGE